MAQFVLSADDAGAQLRRISGLQSEDEWNGVETRLRAYVDLLIKWNKRINLVGPATLADIWRRHILDCAQLLLWVPKDARSLADLGSGAGLPGLILAILGIPNVHLIESDARKCAFLREAARLTKSNVTIHNCRIETAPAIGADVVAARALAPMLTLLPLARQVSRPGGICLFLKGQNWREEISGLKAVDVIERPSLTEPGAVILQLPVDASMASG